MWSYVRSFLTTVVPWVSSLLVLALMGLVAFVGWRLEWKITSFSDIPCALWLAPESAPKDGEEAKPAGPPAVSGRVRLASMETLEQAGIETAKVEERDMTQSVTAPGEIEYDPSRLASVAPCAAGTLTKVYKKVGDKVREGEVLAIVDAAEVGKAKTELLQALVQADARDKELQRLRNAGGGVGGAEVLKAEVAMREARLRILTGQQALANFGLAIKVDELARMTDEQALCALRSLGLPAELSERPDADPPSMNLLPIRAPFNGVVLRRSATLGDSVTTAGALFALADLSHVWLTLYIRLNEAHWLNPKLKQKVGFSIDSHGGEEEEVAEGFIDWVSPEVDEKSHTIRARAQLDNPEGRLRPGTFGSGKVIVREQKAAVTVPAEALHWDGGTSMVFVKIPGSEADFDARFVTPGLREGKQVEVSAALSMPTLTSLFAGQLASSGGMAPLNAAATLQLTRFGVAPGEEVATTGSHALKAELFKDRIGAADE